MSVMNKISRWFLLPSCTYLSNPPILKLMTMLKANKNKITRIEQHFLNNGVRPSKGACMTPGNWYIYVTFIENALIHSEWGPEAFFLPWGTCKKQVRSTALE